MGNNISIGIRGMSRRLTDIVMEVEKNRQFSWLYVYAHK